MSASDSTPTVVLVHGTFVDASSWNGVIPELRAAGLDVVAPPNLLRGVGTDAAYLTGFVTTLGRPVVLAGHSYAGAVISQTGSDPGNVAGLVYIAAYAPEAGETLGAINDRTSTSRPTGRRHQRAFTPDAAEPTRRWRGRDRTHRCSPRLPGHRSPPGRPRPQGGSQPAATATGHEPPMTKPKYLARRACMGQSHELRVSPARNCSGVAVVGW